jgi:hypothetical protein
MSSVMNVAVVGEHFIVAFFRFFTDVAIVNTLGRMLFIIFITIDEPGAVFKTLHFLNNL